MAEPFDPTTDPLGQLMLQPQVPGAGDLLPAPMAGVLQPQPVLPHAPPVPLPPHVPPLANSDPRQQLLAIAALGAMLGAGPKSGIGTGFGHGVIDEQNQLRQQLMQREALRQQLQQRADQELATQQKAAAQQEQERQKSFWSAIQALKGEARKAATPEDYQQVINDGSMALRTAGGFRQATPEALMQMVPWVPPEHEQRYVDAWQNWKKNPNNVRLLEQNPAQALMGTISVNVGTKAKPEWKPLPVPQVAELAGEGFSKNPATDSYMIAPKDSGGTSAFDVKLKSLTDVFTATHRRPPTPEEKDALVTKAIEASKEKPPPAPGQEKLIKVERQNPDTGKAETVYLPESDVRGKSFTKPTGQTLENRLASAQAVAQTGEDIIRQLSDPAVANVVGPMMGRATTLRDLVGNPPPAFSQLAGQIESYALANMGVHGMRSAQGAEQIKRLLDAHHTPQSLIAAIRGLNSFSQHFMENEGMGRSQTPAPKSGGQKIGRFDVTVSQ